MEEMTIVYFLRKEASCAKQKIGKLWQYFVQKQQFIMPGGVLHVYQVGIPDFYRNKKPWKDKMLHAYMAGLPVPDMGEDVLYVYEKQVRELLGVKTAPLSEKWLLFLLAYYEPCFVNLIILTDACLSTKELVRKYVRYARFVGYVTKDEAAYSEICEALSWEYGVLPQMEENVKALRMEKGSRLIVGADNLYGASPVWLGTETIWLSAVADSEAKRICARAGEAIYIDIEVFLEDVLRP